MAPVRIGDGAFIGSGSVITDDVPPIRSVLVHGRQERRDGWADQFRKRRQAELAIRAGKVNACVTVP